MKNIIHILLMLLPMLSFAQYPIVDDFSSLGGAGEWTIDNGGNVETYGGDDYLSFSDWPATYLNSTTHTATSPVYDFTDCVNDIEIIFPIIGIIDFNSDFFYFDYFDGGIWVNDLTLTSTQNGVYTNSAIPNTTTQFRFRLVTDVGEPGFAKDNLNGQWSPTQSAQYNTPMDISTQYIGKVRGSGLNLVLPYYYDISSFTINCSQVLPIELISFKSIPYLDEIILQWTTASEINNSYFEVEWGSNGDDWKSIKRIEGAGNSNITLTYNTRHNNPGEDNYYRLKQTDFDGKYSYSDIIYQRINIKEAKQSYSYINILGQDVDDNYKGLKIKKPTQ